MKYTILGASGFIGQHLVETLRTKGIDVFAPGRTGPDIFRGNLGHVIYCIGVTADFRSKPFETVDAHVCTLADILRRCEFDSFLYLSSTRVYGRALNTFENVGITVDPANALDIYNISKLMGESLCLACNRKETRVARVANVVGKRSAFSEDFVDSIVRDAKSGHVVLRTSLISAKDYIRIDDVVDLLTEISKRGASKIYNVASGRQISHADWMARLAKATGCGFDVVKDSPVSSFPNIDISLIRAEFGFEARDVFELLPALIG